MTAYVITVPGTFLRTLDADSRAALLRALRPADPQHTALGEAEELDMLTVNEGGTFSVRLEIEADNRRGAEAEAKKVAGAALSEAGFSADEAPLGPAFVTGIDSEY
ncbi:hypothetical protein GCM10011583_06630 [Streptomyces camponoticapitis]|uniref:Uncharacterized protein n=1 Tax=Streptomyces camponoticapitis TaxID=1616125 RepID=A0ABQ2DY28_9ACTN|nr:hypothetical protein [Streptomyces camponoticapitis]GGJ77906.1 hypothetical protein GCM10011583_06630 [Streptomyces camponoticapitis]